MGRRAGKYCEGGDIWDASVSPSMATWKLLYHLSGGEHLIDIFGQCQKIGNRFSGNSSEGDRERANLGIKKTQASLAHEEIFLT